MWGWSWQVCPQARQDWVFPTHVGVILLPIHEEAGKKCIPHTCGGDPKNNRILLPLSQYSPHMWGWSFKHWVTGEVLPVFPTHVGVILRRAINFLAMFCIPHTCGGDPKQHCSRQWCKEYSPHMWGWSRMESVTRSVVSVFPTHVGVILNRIHFPIEGTSIPHTCGGDPSPHLEVVNKARYSPHMWGWSCCWATSSHVHYVFPTHVGVILSCNTFCIFASGIPHTCGGDPSSHHYTG